MPSRPCRRRPRSCGRYASAGTAFDAHDIRRSFKKVAQEAGLDADAWTPLEMRHSFESLSSYAGVPMEHISRLIGHSGSADPEAV
jgi:site-specific recombinase XerD